MHIKDEKALQQALKGYMCSATLSLHKSRIIIPHILQLMRRKEFANSQFLVRFIKANID